VENTVKGAGWYTLSPFVKEGFRQGGQGVDAEDLLGREAEHCVTKYFPEKGRPRECFKVQTKE